MPTFRMKVHTGPVNVSEYGQKLKRAGLKVVTVGTENVYVDVVAADCTDARIKMEDKLRRKYKRDFGLPRSSTCLLERNALGRRKSRKRGR